MKKIFAFALFLILLASAVSAAMCTDSDDGNAYDEVGDTKYGITTFTDTCVLSEQADMSTKESSFLKEYYCKDDKRVSEIVECSREGFISCKEGKCLAPEGSQASTKTTTTYATISCGDHKLNQASEECDPPGKICFKNEDVGQCTASCKCEVMVEDAKESSEETAQEKPENTDEKTAQAEQSEPTEEKQSDEKTAEQKKTPAPRLPSEEREELPVVKEPGFFGKIWKWFKGLFG